MMQSWISLRYLAIDVHGHAHGDVHAAHGPKSNIGENLKEDTVHDDAKSTESSDENAAAQVIGVAILEFGVLLHRLVCFILRCIIG
jgi:hypothetical protein